MAPTQRHDEYKTQLEQALSHTRRVLRYSKRAKKALESVRKRDISLSSVDDFREARTSVRKVLGKTGSAELESELTDWLAATSDRVAQTADERHRQLLSDLKAVAEERDVPFRKLGDTPPTVAMGSIRIVLEPGQDAVLKLGLEPIRHAPADSHAILEAIEDVRRHWEARTPAAAELFDRILRAYLMCCSKQAINPGGRVELVDLLGPLAFVECSATSFRKKGLASLTEYPGHLLARQLSILNRERLLQHDGYRLELGAATGGSTRDKRDVLYVQTSPTQGQYFLTIRFTQQ